MSMVSVVASLMLTAQMPAVVPPPPPHVMIYDPVPGPYAISVDARGTPEDVSVLDNAVEGWRGPGLSAFLLCFRPGNGAYDPQVALASFRAVSRELKARGAAIVVVVEPAYRCRAAARDTLANVAHVEILGVLRDPS